MKEPIQLSVMRLVLGIEEIPGPKSNPIIMRWAREIGAPAWFNDDDKAWCAVGMNRVLLAAGLPMARLSDTTHADYRAGFDLLRAATFMTYGVPLSEPTLGCLLTFSRPEGAHVGLYVGERALDYRVIGANQKNAITEQWIKKERCTAKRWPPNVPYTLSGPIRLTDDGKPSSINEK